MTVGVYDTVHVAMFGALPALRVHVADGLKLPVLFVVKLTVPVGTVGLDEVSTTRAVHVVAVVTKTEPGEQVTLVCVGWAVVTATVIVLDVPMLPLCVASPP